MCLSTSQKLHGKKKSGEFEKGTLGWKLNDVPSLPQVTLCGLMWFFNLLLFSWLYEFGCMKI